ncbi:MAG: response regulator [Vicinamibacteria bacterium]|nr:response regulator [Vicinamibacteria bacterium]
MHAKCPQCSAAIAAEPDANGYLTCPSCKVRLQIASQPAATPKAPSEPLAVPAPAPPPAVPLAEIRSILNDVRDLRRLQAEILQYQAQVLALLKSWPVPVSGAPAIEKASPADKVEKTEADHAAAFATPAPTVALPVPRVRQRRKSVLIVDDNDESLQAAMAALNQAQVPSRFVTNGNAALNALATEKPDVLILELDLGEPMSGKDLINYIKATMEWIDIPILLYTRLPIPGQEEARTEHGADDLVLKGPGSPEALVNHVIKIFQRGH